jgi:transcriptional regulator NrdR family protein
MTCPRCAGATEVFKTLAETDHIIRKRRCVECQYIFRTIEIDVDFHEKLLKGNDRYVKS